MRYFKITSKFAGKHPDRRDDAYKDEESRVISAGDSYIAEKKKAYFACVTALTDKRCEAVFAGNGMDEELYREIDSFWEKLELNEKITSITEVSANQVYGEINRSRLELADDMEETFDVECIRRIPADEHIVRFASEENLSEFARDIHFPELEAEAERIGNGEVPAQFLGHPAHYLVEEDDNRQFIRIAEHLVDALHRRNRLQSRRMIILTPKVAECCSSRTIAKIYRNFTDGTVVVSVSKDQDNGEYADETEELIELACEEAKKHRNDVLTIFHIPRHNHEASRLIESFLGSSMTLIRLREEPGDLEKSREYMTSLCEERHVTDVQAFLDLLTAEHGTYYRSDIEKLFDAHYDKYLKSTHFRAYMDCEPIAPQIAKVTGSAADTLHDMIGLGKVKSVIEQSVSYFKMQNALRRRGITLNQPAKSMLFTGNPGTAKTTVARLTAKIFKDNGLLESGRIVEVGRADLVGKYVGWTAQLVKQAFKRAKGSILFIDEAYSLVDDRDGMYGDEAINTIVQEMENNREDTIVIFAGYPDKMEKFLAKNPGLRSRIAFHVDFPDYNADELLEILRLMVKEQSLSLSADAEEKARSIFDKALQIHDFGNGRFVRNLLEQAQMHMAQRLGTSDMEILTDSQITTLTAEDFEMPQLCAQTHMQQVIGF